MANEEEKEQTKKHLSRREFLKDAGLIVGGATVGSMALVNACSGATTTVTAPGATSTKTVTTTLPGGTGVVTTTVTQPGPTVTTTAPGTVQVVDPRATFNVNGTDYKVEVEPYWSLGFVLREKLGFTALKLGCDRGECGHCTVLLDGKTVYSCLVLAPEAAGGKKIETAESLSADGFTLQPIAKAFYDNNAFQCGYCTPGVLLATKALLAESPHPTLQQVKEGLSGNLCVCSGWKKVVETVMKLGGS